MSYLAGIEIGYLVEFQMIDKMHVSIKNLKKKTFLIIHKKEPIKMTIKNYLGKKRHNWKYTSVDIK